MSSEEKILRRHFSVSAKIIIFFNQSQTMENITATAQDKVYVTLPIKINYRVANEILNKKLRGKIIKKEDKDGSVKEYAEVLSANVKKTSTEGYDLLLTAKLKTLTSIFKNKEVELRVLLAVEFKEAEQKIVVEDFEINGRTGNWFLNSFVETVVNTFMYGNLKKKMKFDLKPLLGDQLDSLNKKLLKGLQPVNGIFLNGQLNDLRVVQILAGEDHLLVVVQTSGNALANIRDIDFLNNI